MKQRELSPIVIVILITLAVGGYLIYKLPRTVVAPQTPQATPIPTDSAASPAPTDAGKTANWKTYQDPKNQFSFKYPSNWINFKLKNPTTNTEYSAFSPVRVSDYDQLSNKGIIVIINTQETRVLSAGWKEIVVNGQQAGRLSLESMCIDKYCPTWSDTIIFKDKSLSVSLTARALEALQNNEPILDQILSTFKFTQ